MRKYIKYLVVTGALGALAAVPAGASAMSYFRATPCQPATPGFVFLLDEGSTTCNVARAVERYWVGHEIFSGQRLTISGIPWTYRHVSSTEANFSAGPWKFVTIDHRPSG
jgi:hypothetical protein